LEKVPQQLFYWQVFLFEETGAFIIFLFSQHFL
jgi:hypothetical protein